MIINAFSTLQRISKIKPFVNKYNWKGVNYPSKIYDCKKCKKSKPQIDLMFKKIEYISCLHYEIKHNSWKPNDTLNFSNREGWHYLAVKELSDLFRGLFSKNNDDFYCLKYLHSFRTKSRLESHEKVCENTDFCGVVISSEDTRILQFSQYWKSDKAGLESVIKKVDVKIILKNYL